MYLLRDIVTSKAKSLNVIWLSDICIIECTTFESSGIEILVCRNSCKHYLSCDFADIADISDKSELLYSDKLDIFPNYDLIESKKSFMTFSFLNLNINQVFNFSPPQFWWSSVKLVCFWQDYCITKTFWLWFIVDLYSENNALDVMYGYLLRRQKSISTQFNRMRCNRQNSFHLNFMTSKSLAEIYLFEHSLI